MRLRHGKDYPHNALNWYFQVHTVNDKHTWKYLENCIVVLYKHEVYFTRWSQ
mgnify:CR=1 FL=1